MNNEPTIIGYGIESTWQPTHAEIDRIACNIIAQVQEGNISATKAVTILRALSDAIENALNQLKPQTIEELQRYARGERIVVNGVELQVKEAGVRYDYAQCGDTTLNNLMQQRDALEKEIKQRQKLLQAIKGVEMLVDQTTGEICEVRPPVKTSTTTYVVSFPKQ